MNTTYLHWPNRKCIHYPMLLYPKFLKMEKSLIKHYRKNFISSMIGREQLCAVQLCSTCCGNGNLMWTQESQNLIQKLKCDKQPLWRCPSQKPRIGLLSGSQRSGNRFFSLSLIHFRDAKWRKGILCSFGFLEPAISKHRPLDSSNKTN